MTNRTRFLLPATCAVAAVGFSQFASAQTFAPGDLFVTTQSGNIQWRNSVGANYSPARTINTGDFGSQAGLRHHPLSDFLWVTNFNSVGAPLPPSMRIIDTTGAVVGSPDTTLQNNPESVCFDSSGNAYMGGPNGDLVMFNSAGVEVDHFTLPVAGGAQGPDWVDLAPDQRTIYYSYERQIIKRYDLQSRSALPDFADLSGVMSPGDRLYTVRLLCDGGLIVAGGPAVYRLDAAGGVAFTYDTPGEDFFFSLALAPDGASFWTGSLGSAGSHYNVYHFDMATGAVLHSFDRGIPVSGLAVFGDRGCVTTTPPPPPPCAHPPRNMVLWLPFDETTGTNVQNVSGPINGTLVGSPNSFTSKVGNAQQFYGDRVTVTDYPAINPGLSDFSIDAWISTDIIVGPPCSRQGTHTIVEKHLISAGSGYHFYLENTGSPCADVLRFLVKDTSGNQQIFTTAAPAIPIAAWTHVAVTFARGGSNTAVFYVNGTPFPATSTGTPATGSITNIDQLTVGIAGGGGYNHFIGTIDEVEIFQRALNSTEVAAIFNAGSFGKCKEFCFADWDRSFYGSQTTIVVPLSLCNSTNTVQCYNLSYFPLTCPFSTGTPSPVGITASPIPPIWVQPGQCNTVWLNIPRPPYVNPGDNSCYTVCMTNTDTGEVRCCDGSVQWIGGSVVIDWPPIARGDFVIDVDVDFGPIPVTPIDPPATGLTMRVVAVGPDMEPDFTAISINGLPPGEPWVWDLKGPLGQPQDTPLMVRMVANDPNQPYYLILEADINGDGDLEQIESITLLGHLADPCAPTEDEDFEFHPPGTACGIEGFIPWQNGVDVCGVVSTEQASSGNRSLKIVGAVGGAGGQGDDTVLPVSGVESGVWTFKCMTFVPTGATGDGAIILLNTYDDVTPPPANWYSAQVRFRAGSGLIQADFGAGVTAMIKGQWVELRLEIDLDNDLADYFYNGVQFVTDRPWTDGVVPGSPGPARLRAIDFYAGEPSTNGITAMYIDDVLIKAPCDLGGGGADCNDNGVDDATDIAKGTSLDCYNAALGSGNSPDAIPDECQCIADWNRDGTVNSTDVSDFINTYFADQAGGSANVDINCDGVSNSTDVSEFINLWFAAQSGLLPYAGCSI